MMRRNEEELYMNGWNDAVEAIVNKSMGALQWIPCSERLPEEGQACLVSDRETILIDIYIGHGNPYNWRGYVKDYEAWMPLPEPYKADMRGEE